MIKKLGTMLIAGSAIALSLHAGSAAAQSNAGYLTDTRNVIVKTPYNLCVRTSFWTPAMAVPECEAGLAPAERPGAAPGAAPAGAARPGAPAAAPRPVTEKVTMAADTFFDFDKATVKPDGKAKLDDLVGKLRAVNLEVVIAVGHTDSVGSNAYNTKLSLRRAEAVKAYLVSKGIPANRIYTEGKGETQPIASNKTKEGRAKNRRVEIEVVGTRSTPK